MTGKRKPQLGGWGLLVANFTKTNVFSIGSMSLPSRQDDNHPRHSGIAYFVCWCKGEEWRAN